MSPSLYAGVATLFVVVASLGGPVPISPGWTGTSPASPPSKMSTNSPSRTAVAATDDSVAYRINAAHTGAQPDTLTAPIQLAWRANLGGRPSYPLIAGGRIFV